MNAQKPYKMVQSPAIFYPSLVYTRHPNVMAHTREQHIQHLHETLKQRILLLDGATGTMIQRHKLDEAAYRGERFADWPSDLKGNNDLLAITQPEIIRGIQGDEETEDDVSTNSARSPIDPRTLVSIKNVKA